LQAARPGGNLTGVAFLTETLIIKRLEIIRELIPNSAVIAVMLNPENPNVGSRVADIQSAARTIGQSIQIVYASSDEEFETTFARLAMDRIGALVIQNDDLFNNRHAQLAALSVQYAIPSIMEVREFVTAGGLMGYGPDLKEAWRQVGIYAGRILKGEMPADLPVVRPTKFEFVINLKTAKALGLNLPPTLLAIADEVIE
jgi:putative ABC transport system substrate-binding protein